ncbi:MAG: hypothetical protein MAG551_00037 [Candidatus Scalindua arabica]|uniref:Uncharacterized protein n=1 Tax=Candidatus Scalindua arabica TaxID=1127984 RepID=A0A941VZJ6_9BACT|nr:hypothetical protein [Candidatus Scalindua arabica]
MLYGECLQSLSLHQQLVVQLTPERNGAPSISKIEVKSTAYVQSWSQKKLSSIQFSIQPTQGWDATSNTYSSERVRQSDIYVFCVLSHKNKKTIDPLNLDQWEFYVIDTDRLNRSVGNQKRIMLSRLIKLGPRKVTYKDIAATVKRVKGNIIS